MLLALVALLLFGAAHAEQSLSCSAWARLSRLLQAASGPISGYVPAEVDAQSPASTRSSAYKGGAVGPDSEPLCSDFFIDFTLPIIASGLAGVYGSRIVGSMTVTPGPVRQDGMSHVRIRVDLLEGAHVFIAPPSSPTSHNLRIAITRRLPEDCASTEFYHAGVHVDPAVYGSGVGVHVPLPAAVYSCTAETTDPFLRAVFIRVDVDLSDQLGGGTQTTVSVGDPQDLLVPGCPYNIVYGACNPAACNATSAASASSGTADGPVVIDAGSNSEDHAQHSGSTGISSGTSSGSADSGASSAAAASSSSSTGTSTSSSTINTGGDLVASELPAATGPDPPGTPAANAARSADSSSGGGGGANIIAVVAGAVGGAAVVAVAIAGFMYIRARRRRRGPRDSTNGALAQTLMWPGGGPTSPAGGVGTSSGVARFTANGGSSSGGTASGGIATHVSVGGGAIAAGAAAVPLPIAMAVPQTPTSRVAGAELVDSDADADGAGPSSLAAALNTAAAGLFAAAMERRLTTTHSGRRRLGGASAAGAAAGHSFIAYPGLPTCRTTAVAASPSPMPSPGGAIEMSASSHSTSKDSRRYLDRSEDSAPNSPVPQRVAAAFEASHAGAGIGGTGGGAVGRGVSRGTTSHGQDLSSLVVGAVQPPTSFDRRRASARRSAGGGVSSTEASLQPPQLLPQAHQSPPPQLQQQPARVLPVVVRALPAALAAAPAPARGLSWKRRSGRFGSAMSGLMGGGSGPVPPHTNLSGTALTTTPYAAATSGGASHLATPCATDNGGVDLFAMPPPPELAVIQDDSQDAASFISTTSFSAAPSLFGCLPAPAPAAGARPLLLSARTAGTGASDAPAAAAAAALQTSAAGPEAPEVSVLVDMSADDDGTELVVNRPAQISFGSRMRRLLQ
ncbi:hypothetical protein CHLRE_12g487000v5 [Chlamydomonas reinhardtii]|uniref:Pherophorin domain-containing protein n=1 Tax=Chlamydomonas reinhardtii TaxID=3055 RepID=A0A2K3D2E5_CHLRE|nr:uncharacterized protein CHLRE_12g487000v5 [Chlamydomonas reinhardtii]PNW74687.1 hypothetical protein CHLRE_12g487000v5 [Chlamydomonas reinhardtii]